ncbi:nucleotide exchange factor GrpE [Mycolicibacterium thermoresistibile]
MTGNDSHEPVTVTDKRRIDPVTGEVRDPAAGPAPDGPAPEAAESELGGSEEADKAAELLADLQRVQADFANYRKRALRDQELTAERGKATVMSALLPILDDLDRAREHGDLETGPLKAFADKLVNTLEGLGLSGFGAEGEEFDPLLHEAVQHEGDGGHPVIGTVMRRGYRVGEQVIRHAMVGVVDTEPEGGDTPDNAGAEGEQAAESNND